MEEEALRSQRITALHSPARIASDKNYRLTLLDLGANIRALSLHLTRERHRKIHNSHLATWAGPPVRKM